MESKKLEDTKCDEVLKGFDFHPLNFTLPSTYNVTRLKSSGKQKLEAVMSGLEGVLSKVEAKPTEAVNLMSTVAFWIRLLNENVQLKIPLTLVERAKLVTLLWKIAFAAGTLGAAEWVSKPLSTATRLLDVDAPLLYEHLSIDWQPLAEHFEAIAFPEKCRWPTQSHVLQLSHRNSLVKFIVHARRYFKAGAAKEIIEHSNLDNISTSSQRVFRAQGFISLFLPDDERALIGLNASRDKDSTRADHARGRSGGLLMEHVQEELTSNGSLINRWLELWGKIDRCLEWDIHWFVILNRLAKYVHINWEPYVDIIFSHVLDCLRIPVGLKNTETGSLPENRLWASTYRCFALPGTDYSSLRLKSISSFLVTLIGPSTPSALPALLRLLQVTKTYFYPSNSGSWSVNLARLLSGLSKNLAIRIGEEAAELERGYSVRRNGHAHLTSTDCRAMADALLPLSMQAMYSKSAHMVRAANITVQCFCSICPHRVVEGSNLLTGLEEALGSESIEQSHKTPSALGILGTVTSPLLQPLPLIASSLPQILELTLNGIDPGDDAKTAGTLNFYGLLLRNIPLYADAGEGKKNSKSSCPLNTPRRWCAFDEEFSKFSDSEIHALAKTTLPSIQSWTLQLLDKLIYLLASRGPPEKHSTSMKNAGSYLIGRVCRNLFAQLVEKDAKIALTRLARELPGNTAFLNCASDVRSILAAASLSYPSLTLQTFVPSAMDRIMDPSTPKRSLEWSFHILAGASRWAGASLVDDLDGKDSVTFEKSLAKQYLNALDVGMSSNERKVAKAACKLLRQLIRSLLEFYPRDFHRLPRNKENGVNDTWGTTYYVNNVSMQWHVASALEIQVAVKLIDLYMRKPMSELDAAMNQVETFKANKPETNKSNCEEDVRVKSGLTALEWRVKLLQILQAFRGSATVLYNNYRDYDNIPEGGLNIPSLCGLRLEVAKFADRLARFTFKYLSHDTKIQKLTIKLISRCLLDFGGSCGKAKIIERLLGMVKGKISCVVSTSYRKRKLQLLGGRTVDGLVGSMVKVSRAIWIEIAHIHQRLMYKHRGAREARRLLGSKEVLAWCSKESTAASESNSTIEARRCYSCLLDALLLLSSSDYSIVRINAQGSLSTAIKHFPWIIIDTMKPLVLRLGDVKTTYPEFRAALHLLVSKHCIKRLARDSSMTLLIISTLCFNSAAMINSQDEERQKVVADFIVMFWVEFSRYWRRQVVTEEKRYLMSSILKVAQQRPLQSVKDVDDGKGINPSVSLVDSGTKGEWKLHWRFHMMFSSCLQVIGCSFSSSDDLPSEFWLYWFTCIESDVTPIRAQALSVLAALLPTLSPSVWSALDPKVLMRVSSPSFVKVLCNAFAKDHLGDVRGADGQVRRGGRHQWSAGVSEMRNAARQLGRRNRSSWPDTRFSFGATLFTRDHALVAESLMRLIGPRWLDQEVCLFETLESLFQVDGMERGIFHSAAAELMCGLIRGAIVADVSNLVSVKGDEAEVKSDVVSLLWKKLLPLLEKSFRSIGYDFVDCFSEAIRFVASTSVCAMSWLEESLSQKYEKAACNAMQSALTPLVDLFLGEAEKSLRLSNIDDSSIAGNTPAKWLKLLNPIIVEYAVLKPCTKHFAILKVRLFPILVENISHPYRICRYEIALSLSLLLACECRPVEKPYIPDWSTSVYDFEFEEVCKEAADAQKSALSLLYNRFNSYILAIEQSVREEKSTKIAEDKESQKADFLVETGLYLLQSCFQCGDSVNLLSMLPSLLLVLFTAQCNKEEKVKELAKRFLTDIARNVRCRSSNGIQSVVSVLHTACMASEWHVRLSALKFAVLFRAYHLFSLGPMDRNTESFAFKEQSKLENLTSMNEESTRSGVAKMETGQSPDLCLQLLAQTLLKDKDNRLEVQEQACRFLISFIVCPPISPSTVREEHNFLDELVKKFTSEAQTRYNRKAKWKGDVDKDGRAVQSGKVLSEAERRALLKMKTLKKREKALSKRMAGVLGLSAIILAHPYTLPAVIPGICVEVSKHVSDPSPIDGVARQTLADFKRTHQDQWLHWQDHFTHDQWESINDVLVSPHYYA
eukprot:g2120.t1